MNPLQFKYVITWTQNQSPTQWSDQSLLNSLVKIRNQAYETEAELIESEMDKRGYAEAQKLIQEIMRKK